MHAINVHDMFKYWFFNHCQNERNPIDCVSFFYNRQPIKIQEAHIERSH